MGHEVRLVPPIYVKPYVKRGKNDAADAAAICEAMSRPGMRFVPAKSEERQATLMLHKTRELLIKQRTMGVNSLRGHLSEFGIVTAKGVGRIDELIEKAERDATLPETAKAALKILAQHLQAIDASIAALDQEIATVHAQNPISRLLAGIPGIGKLAASAIVASVPDPKVFESGRDFSAWLGMTPDKIPVAARRDWEPSPNKAIATSGDCWFGGQQRCSAPCARGKGLCATGMPLCWRAGPRGWPASQWPTSWLALPGP